MNRIALSLFLCCSVGMVTLQAKGVQAPPPPAVKKSTNKKLLPPLPPRTVSPKQEKVTSLNIKQPQASSLKAVDSIAVIIYTENPIVLTKSDLSRSSINGAKQKKEDVILSRIMDYEAQYVYKIPVSDDAVDKYITSLQEHHQIDKSRLSDMFKHAGYAYEEGVDELRRMLTIDSLLNFKIKSRLVVPEDEVRAYYKEHVQHVPTSFRIKKGFLANDLLTDKELKELKATGKHSDMVEWLNPYWINEDELADSRKFIASMKEGSIAEPEKVGEGYEIIKLLKRKEGRKRTFEESYKEIAEKLRMPLFEKMLEEYKKELMNKYEIVYL